LKLHDPGEVGISEPSKHHHPTLAAERADQLLELRTPVRRMLLKSGQDHDRTGGDDPRDELEHQKRRRVCSVEVVEDDH
jgi:hypothetical protein